MAMKQSQTGFSLIEIMVGMTISLIGMVVIMQVFTVAEGNRATTTTGGDAQQSGALALQSVERDVRMAGYGINIPGFLGCNVV
ncbi:MAG TPA: prepilin-type N-terminal cleavage/methylation domain-containing protein, partial [Methylophilaceae bacterium]|nr:prepilin-type N-terminal cleavage/methylation domain-containing protein [Methylophilaceae bacterium]